MQMLALLNEGKTWEECRKRWIIRSICKWNEDCFHSAITHAWSGFRRLRQTSNWNRMRYGKTFLVVIDRIGLSDLLHADTLYGFSYGKGRNCLMTTNTGGSQRMLTTMGAGTRVAASDRTLGFHMGEYFREMPLAICFADYRCFLQKVRLSTWALHNRSY